MPEYEIKPYEQLDITSNFMFAKVFSNKDVAKDFLQDILFICPDDIFGKGLSIYRFQNRATREYMEYFSTQKHESEKMKRIHELVEKYRLDPIAKKAYVTLEQELNIREKKARKEANKKVAKALLAEGDSIEKVARCTGLTPEEIKAL